MPCAVRLFNSSKELGFKPSAACFFVLGRAYAHKSNWGQEEDVGLKMDEDVGEAVDEEESLVGSLRP